MLNCIVFSDINDDYWDRSPGWAMQSMVKFFNIHKEYKIVSVFKRQRMIENDGHGTEYYDIDVIYESEESTDGK